MNYAEFENQYLKNLNPQQREAVLAVDGAVLLLATPGSGKTTVLVTRLGYMVCCLCIDPDTILTMTYTKAATHDMKKRFENMFGSESAARMQFRTINGVSSKIISHFAARHTRRDPFALQENEGELHRMVREIYQNVNNEYPEDSVIKDIRTTITYIKNMMLSEEEIKSLKTDISNLPEIYIQYQQALRSRRLMDYDDQMSYALNILRKYPQVLKHFQAKYRYICVDEAQDTSKIQHEIIKLLASGTENLFMVGDEDQSIYGFRAAYPEALLSFENDHPGARVLLMEENYRSTQEIIALANSFVAQNSFRREKTIMATRGGGSPVQKIYVKGREAQYRYLLETAKTISGETAVLFRNNDTAMPLIDLFEKANIPYNCRNIDDLFFAHRVVVDVLDIIRFAHSPRDSSLFMRIYYKFGASISKHSAVDAVQKSQRTGKPIFEELIHAVDIRGAVQDAAIDLAYMLPIIKVEPAEKAIQRIWETMRYGKYVEQNKLDRGKYFILRMLAKDSPKAADFLNKMSALRKTVQNHKNSDTNSIILSTIHSSKGLEYKSVYLLDMIDGILPSVPESEVRTRDDVRQYEEDRRLYYVAMTRAKDELNIFNTGENESFTNEAFGCLPAPQINENDCFGDLLRSNSGKTYKDKRYGSGEIIAQCGSKMLISFSDRTEFMTLGEMLENRAEPTYRVQTSKERSPKSDRQSRPPWSDIIREQFLEGIKPGRKVQHKTFGQGIITAKVNDVITVDFGDNGIRRLMLSATITNGLLTMR